ncbi:MAG: hypothetical protein MJZ26_09165 [Fibrobacter sp.]|nr:hypothetical protein [Fibrobacter sp.]
MYTDTTSNGLTHIKAHEGYVMTKGSEIVREIWLTGGGCNEWTEVSDLVLLTPQEQQQRLNELEAFKVESLRRIGELEAEVAEKTGTIERQTTSMAELREKLSTAEAKVANFEKIGGEGFNVEIGNGTIGTIGDSVIKKNL